ncbi:MAG: hypothetical protein FMNOHCHN_00570 [Ignavibacteriaceae bacterium]|nr:hypothetical protein [Ignavibacteriaceae bacterium]
MDPAMTLFLGSCRRRTNYIQTEDCDAQRNYKYIYCKTGTHGGAAYLAGDSGW